MKVNEFVKQLGMNKDKEKYIKECLTTEYVSYAKKIAVCEAINTACTRQKLGDVEMFHVNSPGRYLLTVLNLIDLYTKVDIDFSKPTEEFDALDECGATALLLSIIPQTESKTFLMINDMVRDDILENERSIVGYIDGKMNVLDALGEMMEMDEERVES